MVSRPDSGRPKVGGTGALAFTTGAGDSIAFTTAGGSRPLSDFYRTTGAYYGYRSSAPTAPAEQFPQFTIDVDLGGPDSPAAPVRLYYDPAEQRDASGAIVVDLGADHWNRFDYARGAVCASGPVPGVVTADQTDCRNGGARSLRDILESYPQAAVTEFGFLQQSTGPLAAAVDKLNIGDEVYNFEPATAAVDPALPTPTAPTTDTTSPAPPTRHPARPGPTSGHPASGHSASASGRSCTCS